MTPDALAELETRSRRATDCFIVNPVDISPGGVDPLGLRQINFDLMNQVFPGLNNVARHIRPFTVVTWAWRRTIAIAKQRKAKLPVSVHEDFVARIEVAFVWSMLQRYDPDELDIPGKQRIQEIWGDTKRITFGDEAWIDFVKARRNSTALTAAINYGPGLRAFRLLVDDVNQPGVRVPGDGTKELLEAFEEQLRPILKHKLFQNWTRCSLTRATAEEWSETWDIDDLLLEEQQALTERLIGARASTARRGGFELLTKSCDLEDDVDERTARKAMCEPDDPLVAEQALLWRRIQVRQAFRLALEALFEWVIAAVGGATLTTAALAQLLVDEVGVELGQRAGEWLEAMVDEDVSVVEAMEELEDQLAARGPIAAAALSALVTATLSDPELHDQSERRERLPIALAAADLNQFADEPPVRFVAHMIESWIIAQHTYWSVGRGLADARAGGKRILRLRLVLEPEGWRVTRGRGPRGIPRPTPDRLRTAMSLARECGLPS